MKKEQVIILGAGPILPNSFSGNYVFVDVNSLQEIPKIEEPDPIQLRLYKTPESNEYISESLDIKPRYHKNNHKPSLFQSKQFVPKVDFYRKTKP